MTTKRHITLPVVRHKNMADYQTCTTIATWNMVQVSVSVVKLEFSFRHKYIATMMITIIITNKSDTKKKKQ